MTPSELKQARRKLGLTQSQAAAVLDSDARAVRKYETGDEHSTHRAAPPRYVRLLRAYVAGHRPDDWPL